MGFFKKDETLSSKQLVKTTTKTNLKFENYPNIKYLVLEFQVCMISSEFFKEFFLFFNFWSHDCYVPICPHRRFTLFANLLLL